MVVAQQTRSGNGASNGQPLHPFVAPIDAAHADLPQPSCTQDLSQRTMTGSAWLFASRGCIQGISLVQMTILARILDPAAFGLIALAFLATQAVGIFVNIGSDYALIQKLELEPIDVHTTWWTILARYVVICGCLLLLARPVAHVYHAPEAALVVAAVALIQPIYGLLSPGVILRKRAMDFRSIFKLDLAGAVTGLAVAIVAALVFRDVRALILAYLAMIVSIVLLSHLLFPYRPRRQFSYPCFRHLSGYGRWVLGSSILSFIALQGASVSAGWLFGLAALGIFQMASRFGLLASTQLSEVVLSAETPAYAQIQDNPGRMGAAFLRTVAVLSILIVGLTTLIGLGAPPLLTKLLGDQWAMAATLVPAVAVAGGTQALARMGSPLFLGAGQPKYQFYTDFAQALTLVVLIVPFGRLFGLTGLPCAMALSALVASPIMWIGVKAVTNCTLRSMIKMLAPAFVGAGIMIAIFTTGIALSKASFPAQVGIVWHLTLMAIAGVGFLATIRISEQAIPSYAPLAELSRIMENRWRRLH